MRKGRNLPLWCRNNFFLTACVKNPLESSRIYHYHRLLWRLFVLECGVIALCLDKVSPPQPILNPRIGDCEEKGARKRTKMEKNYSLQGLTCLNMSKLLYIISGKRLTQIRTGVAGSFDMVKIRSDNHYTIKPCIFPLSKLINIYTYHVWKK